MIATFACHLCSTCLSRHTEMLATRTLTSTILFVVHHLLQDALNLLQCLVFADVLLDDFYWELCHHFAISRNTLHEAWAHHPSVIGNSIIEGHGGDRRNLCVVTYRHPRQRSLRPISFLLVRTQNMRIGSTIERQIQRCSNAHSLQSSNEFLWLIMIVLINQSTHTDIGRTHHSEGHVEHAASASCPVGIAHSRSIHVINAATRIDLVVQRDFAIVECHHNRSGFEGRTRLHHGCQGIVSCLVVIA